MTDHANVKPAAPLYWCGHWTSLNVHPCQSCVEAYGKQTAYYRESDYFTLMAERDAIKEKFDHLESEWVIGRDRGDSVVYRHEREAFDAWQRSGGTHPTIPGDPRTLAKEDTDE